MIPREKQTIFFSVSLFSSEVFRIAKSMRHTLNKKLRGGAKKKKITGAINFTSHNSHVWPESNEGCRFNRRRDININLLLCWHPLAQHTTESCSYYNMSRHIANKYLITPSWNFTCNYFIQNKILTKH